jgi:hypothetical protein
MKFIKTCLKLNVIPYGFRLKFHGIITGSSVLSQCSKRLMRSTLDKLQTQSAYVTTKIGQLCISLRQMCPDILLNDIRFKIHCLNAKLYGHCQYNKSRKLLQLLPNHNFNKHASMDATNRTVVTIPSDISLDPAERSVLQKGLKFIPAKSLCQIQMEQDLERFYRRLRLHAHFNKGMDEAMIEYDLDQKTENYFDKFERKHKKQWTPNEGEFNSLDHFIDKTRRDVSEVDIKFQNKYNNITVQERKALKKLQQRQDIVIKQADKGGATVVWSKDLYITEGERQLQDKHFYKQLTNDITMDNNKAVKQVITKCIDKRELPQEAKSLIQSKPKPSKFYMCPKIHKANNPGRPIVSNFNCPTEHISHYLSDLFQPIVNSLPSYIKDTTDLLNKLSNFKYQSPQNQTIFTMDVKSLYTVIPNKEGLKAIKYYLQKRSTQTPSTDTIVRLAELVLELNCFSFNDKFYSQIGGVCMGTRMGPNYACMFMGYLEHAILQTYQGTLPQLYVRFIDDILCAGNMTEQQVLQFTEFYGHFNPSIEVSVDTGTPITFLDTTLSVGNHTINSSIHYKPTDSHAYVHYQSSHPKKCLTSIPYSQLLRVKRICSSEVDYHKQATIVGSFFEKRSYPTEVIESAHTRANSLERHTLLQPPKKTTNSKIPLVLTYNRCIQPVVTTIFKNFSILQNDLQLSSLFPQLPLVSYRRDRNLKDTLVHSAVSNKPINNNPVKGTFPCQRPRCKTCQHTSNDLALVAPNSTFTINQHFTCIDSGVIYAIHCMKCNDIYIGETERKLAERFREHLYLVNTQQLTKSTVAQHFNLPNHSYTDMEVLGLCHVKNDPYRKIVEKRLIKKLGTLVPLGLNTLGDHP